MKKTITMRIPDGILQKLRREAAENRRSVSVQLEILIQNKLAWESGKLIHFSKMLP